MEQDNKLHFFKRMKVAIFNLEDYGKFLGEHGSKAIKYFLLLILLLSCVWGFSEIYFLNNGIVKLKKYIVNELPELTLTDNKLSVERKIEAYDEEYKLRLFIDTDPQITDEMIRQYKSKVYLNEYAIILLEKEAIIINKSNNKSIKDINNLNDFFNYIFGNNSTVVENEILRESYESLNKEYDISFNNKNDFINFIEDNNSITVSIICYISLTIALFVIKLIYSICDLIMLAIFGYLVALFCKIRFKWQAPTILAVYSLTLSIVLSAVYSVIYRLTGFEIKYFDVMYLLIAHVYIIASIFIIRTDIIKDATELKRIFEEQEKIKKEKENMDEETNDENQNSDKKKKDDEKNDDEKNDENPDVNNGEPDGSEI